MNTMPKLLSNFPTLLFLLVLLMQIDKTECFYQHPIFGNQTILEAMAKTNYYNDSKQFVDQVLKVPIQEALKTFQEKGTLEMLKTCFNLPESILQRIQLPDFNENPPKLNRITNTNFSQFARDLNQRWNQLARRVNLNYTNSTTGRCVSNCSTFLPEMDGKIIVMPGGRFRESYYWDSYWIVKGLIVCGMLETAEKLVDNFIMVIEKYGFIPNGFRLYYLNRSQPPFFSMMVKQLAEAYRQLGNKDKADALQERAFNPLITQQKYFMTTHSVSYTLKSGKQIQLNIYNADTKSPRPQAYAQDLQLAQSIQDPQQKQKVMKSISTIAESGWDFSSRWFKDVNNLRSSVILEMVPSDLNALMGMLESYLATLAAKYGRIDLLNYYQQMLRNRKDYFTEIFNGQRFPDKYPTDVNTDNRQYPTDYLPFMLFSNMTANTSKFNQTVNPVCSNLESKQQWDKPNVWAPNSWIFHEVSSATEDKKFAQQWVSTVYCSWKKPQKPIYEKYRSDVLGERGEGGQYETQTGFGWTNGLALYYLSLYPTILEVPKCS